MRIFLDMDGVLCDFMWDALVANDRHPVKTLQDWPIGTFDVCEVIGVAPEEFWKRIDKRGHRFWSELAEYQWTRELVSLVAEFDPSWFVSTSPSQSPDSSSGKVEWLQIRFGKDFRRYMLGPSKELLAKPGAVLIDDREESVETFREHGGEAVLFPQPWNSLGAMADPVNHVRQQLELIRGI